MELGVGGGVLRQLGLALKTCLSLLLVYLLAFAYLSPFVHVEFVTLLICDCCCVCTMVSFAFEYVFGFAVFWLV